MTLLYWDVKNQIYYQICPESQTRESFHNELKERKIVLWARHHSREFPDEMRNEAMIQSVLNGDVDSFLQIVKEREKFLVKHHYWKMKLLDYYKNAMDCVGYLAEKLYSFSNM